jgi:hypothetical protein
MDKQFNQYALSKMLGSKMKPVKDHPQFGNFGLLETTAETLKALGTESQQSDRSHGFNYQRDAVLVQAFESVRDGASPDSLLWNRKLARKFDKACRQSGIDAPEKILKRRLINVRKNSPRYKKHGIVLSHTTKKDPHPSIVPQYAHVIEFALVRLRYRYGSSIDDILLDPVLADAYEEMCYEIAPQLSSIDVRLAALYIRKSRFLPKKKKAAIESLNLDLFDQACSEPHALESFDLSVVPSGPGIVEVRERERFLYISRNENLRPAVSEFLTGKAFLIVSSGFWQPDRNVITIQFASGKSVAGTGIANWERRLIYDREPIFNWPLRHTAA